MILIVTGIPGTGKTTVMNKALEKYPLKFVTFGTVMFAIAKKKSLVSDRDELRKLPFSTQREIQELAAVKIKNMANVVVDTHCTIKTKAGYLPGLPDSVLKKLSPNQHIPTAVFVMSGSIGLAVSTILPFFDVWVIAFVVIVAISGMICITRIKSM